MAYAAKIETDELPEFLGIVQEHRLSPLNVIYRVFHVNPNGRWVDLVLPNASAIRRLAFVDQSIVDACLEDRDTGALDAALMQRREQPCVVIDFEGRPCALAWSVGLDAKYLNALPSFLKAKLIKSPFGVDYDDLVHSANNTDDVRKIADCVLKYMAFRGDATLLMLLWSRRPTPFGRMAGDIIHMIRGYI